MMEERFGGFGRRFGEPVSQSDTGKDRDQTEDPEVVSGSQCQTNYISQDLNLDPLDLRM